MNRWFFWVLAPVMLGTAVLFEFYLPKAPTWQGELLVHGISAILLLATLGLADVRRFQWALKFVAGGVLIAYSIYLGSEAWLWWNGQPLGFLSSRSQSNLMNAIGGFIAFGVPSIVFLLKGRSGTAVDAIISEEDST
jgi:hypothetical protein